MLLAAVFAPLIESKTTELTFELRDREKQCFHEDIEIGTKASIVFQVIHGGELDVDMIVYSPSKTILYQDSKTKWDAFEWNATEAGQYTFCFGNEFSITSNKLLYFEFIVGDEVDHDSLLPENTPEHKAALDVMKFQIAAQTIYENLETISEAQTSYRLAEASQRKRAEDLRSRVNWWSASETCAVVLISFIQLWLVKGMFARHNAYVQIS